MVNFRNKSVLHIDVFLPYKVSREMTGKPRAEIFQRLAFNLLQNRTELRHLAEKADKIMKETFLFRIKK